MSRLKAILNRLARFIFRIGLRLFRPLLPTTKRYIQVYKERRFEGLYHAHAVSNETFCFVGDPVPQQPLISVVVATFNTDARHLSEMIYSVVNQHYENWELVLVNASTEKIARNRVAAAIGIDSRIRVIDMQSNEGIAGNGNVGIKAAKGEFIAFLDHDDLLHPCALDSVASTIAKTGADIVYTDEDKISDGSDRYFNPLCKPKFSPDLLRNVNYFNHLTVIRRELVMKVGGLRKELEGAQDYDLLLRVIDECHPTIKSVPRILYHWRAAATSTANDISTKTYIFKAGTKALQQHLDRTHRQGSVVRLPNKPGFYKMVYDVPRKINLVIGPVSSVYQADSMLWLKQLVAKLNPDQFQLIVGDWLPEDELKDIKVKTVAQGSAYWSKVAEIVRDETVIVFQQAVSFKHDSALTELASLIQAGPNTVAMPVLVDAQNNILDSGLVETEDGRQKLFLGHKYGRGSFMGPTDWIRNVDGSTLRVFVMHGEQFKQAFGQTKKPELKDSQLKRDTQFMIWGLVAGVPNGVFNESFEEGFINSQLMQPSSQTAFKPRFWLKEDE